MDLPLPPREITELLQAWSAGEKQALDRLTPLVYEELHRLAHRYVAREQTGHSLQTSALVNEVYLRLVDIRNVRWQDRAHFFALSARMMRNILTDMARARKFRKRGGSATRLSLDSAPQISKEIVPNLVALDDALKNLSEMDARKSQVVELRFFGGLSVEETAEVLKISPETVKRDWRSAKAWLAREMGNVVDA